MDELLLLLFFYILILFIFDSILLFYKFHKYLYFNVYLYEIIAKWKRLWNYIEF